MKKIIIFIVGFISIFGLFNMNERINVLAIEGQEIESYFEEGKSKENENRNNLDDGELPITFEEFEQNYAMYRNNSEIDIVQESRVFDGVEIIDTNFNWNGELDLSNNPKTIVLHHIAATRPGQTIPVTDIHKWHLENGWTGIGYHFYVTKTGKIYRGRPENALGAHAKNFNKDSLGIAVEGEYQKEQMPNIQKVTVEKLAGYLRSKYDIDNVKGHGELMATSCPGKNYPLNSIRNNILNYPIYSEPELPSNNGDLELQYVSHVQNEGWQNWVKNGDVSGSVGLARRVEGIKINLANAGNSKINYRTHIQDIGWQEWKSNGQISGTKMQAKRIEAIEIKLDGDIAKNYDVEYRTHIQDRGWQEWKSNGQISGTTGQNLRVEALQIRLIKKTPKIEYRTHIQDIGWQNYKSDGETSGTSGQEKRLEAIKIKSNINGVNINYRTHIQDIGWQDWKSNDELSGTEAQSKRIEAIEVQLDGQNAHKYSIQYRVHVENIGWMPWKNDGVLAGTTGEAKRIEALEIRLIEK